MFLSRWLFDVEILARCRNATGVPRLLDLAVEEPLLEWIERGGSKIKARYVLRVPKELWQLHRAYNRGD